MSLSTHNQARRILTEAQRTKAIAKGKLPPGWIVYHMKPLYKGGGNSFSNLRVMRDTLHRRLNKRLHYYKGNQNPYRKYLR